MSRSIIYNMTDAQRRDAREIGWAWSDEEFMSMLALRGVALADVTFAVPTDSSTDEHPVYDAQLEIMRGGKVLLQGGLWGTPQNRDVIAVWNTVPPTGIYTGDRLRALKGRWACYLMAGGA